MTSEAKTIVETVRYIDQSSAAVPAKIPYQKRLRLFNGRMSHDSFWKGVVKPIPLICYPAVLFSTVINGFHFASMVGMSLVLLTVLHAKPYDLDPSQIGMTNIPHLIVSFIFAPISGFLADWIAKSLSRRNKGIFEPEFRLLLMIIVVPIATIAFIGLGIVVEQKKSLAHILVFSSLQAVSVPFASQAALTYVLDSHPRDSNQAFVTVNFVKTLLIFLFTSKISGWYESAGPRKLFNTLAAINLLLSCLTIPFYMYGKRFRSRVS
jgi:MFS family permease